MNYDELVEELSMKIGALDYVKAFQRSEEKLRAERALFETQEEMKRLQKEASLYQRIGKMQAYKETSQAAQKLEKSIKHHPIVEEYAARLADVNDLVQHLTGEIERKVNDCLENDEC